MSHRAHGVGLGDMHSTSLPALEALVLIKAAATKLLSKLSYHDAVYATRDKSVRREKCIRECRAVLPGMGRGQGFVDPGKWRQHSCCSACTAVLAWLKLISPAV